MAPPTERMYLTCRSLGLGHASNAAGSPSKSGSAWQERYALIKWEKSENVSKSRNGIPCFDIACLHEEDVF